MAWLVLILWTIQYVVYNLTEALNKLSFPFLLWADVKRFRVRQAPDFRSWSVLHCLKISILSDFSVSPKSNPSFFYYIRRTWTKAWQQVLQLPTLHNFLVGVEKELLSALWYHFQRNLTIQTSEPLSEDLGSQSALQGDHNALLFPVLICICTFHSFFLCWS